MPWPRLPGAVHVAVWIFGAFRRALWRLRERLRAHDAAPEPLTAIIPARKVQHSIGHTVASPRTQQFGGPPRIFLADDESVDRTAEAARAVGADLVIRIGPRP